MIRRKFIAGTAVSLLAAFSGCVADRDDETDQNESENDDYNNNNNDDDSKDDSDCFEVIIMYLIDVEDYTDWEETDVSVVDSNNEKISNLSPIQDLLERAIETGGTIEYEYQEEWFDAVEKSERTEYFPESDKLMDVYPELPSDHISGIPSGPYIHHEDRHFSLIVETEEPCPE